MGCVSFMCKESGLPISSNSFDGDAVRLFLLEDGKVIEEMVGHYDSYTRVFDKDGNRFEWKMDWLVVCMLINHQDKRNGIAAVLECHWKGNIPTERSEMDENQGWGKPNGGGIRITEPYHKVY